MPVPLRFTCTPFATDLQRADVFEGVQAPQSCFKIGDLVLQSAFFVDMKTDAAIERRTSC